METALIILASIVVGVLIAQTVILVVFVITFRNWCNRTGALMDEITRNVAPVLQSARELLTESRDRLNTISSHLTEISHLTRNQVIRLDGFLKDASDRAQLQLIRLDQLLSDSVFRAEKTLDAVQRGILTPVRELSAIVAGIRTALDFLTRRHKREVERVTQDEELFI